MLVNCHDGNKKWDAVSKNMYFIPKRNHFFAHKSVISTEKSIEDPKLLEGPTRKRRVMPSCIHKCGFRNMRSTPEIIYYVDFLCVFSMCTSWFWKLADSVSVDLNWPLLTLPSSNGFADFISFLDKDFHPNVVHSHPKQLVVDAPSIAFFPFRCHGWQHTDMLRPSV